MTRFEDAFRCITTDLGDLGIGWVAVGGLALNAHGVPWPCSDLDIVVSPDHDGALAGLADALRARGHMVQQVSHDTLKEMLVVLPGIPGEPPLGVLVDVLPRACGFEAEMVAAAQRMPVLGVDAPIARVGHLIAFKMKAMYDVTRARDRKHLRALLELASDEDRDTAREALRLSIERGVLRVDDPYALFDRYPLGPSLRPTEPEA